MKWEEKIRMLTAGKNASRLAVSVGLHKSAIRDAAATGQMPRADKAIKIARALGVSCDWLFDDVEDWPPPPSTERTSMAFDEVLDRFFNRDNRLLELATAIVNAARSRKDDLTKDERDEVDAVTSALQSSAADLEMFGQRITAEGQKLRELSTAMRKDVLDQSLLGHISDLRREFPERFQPGGPIDQRQLQSGSRRETRRARKRS